MRDAYIAMVGGIDGTTPLPQMAPGRLRAGQNVEAKLRGGYRRCEGYTAYDSNAVPGSGSILGVQEYNGKVYAFRNAADGLTAAMYSSEGSGWTLEKSGLAPGGRYRFVNEAFAGTLKMYGASGVHKAFEWDGSTWNDITTGMATDEPTHITAHKQHLFLSFGKSVQHSALGDPTSWTPLLGAGEILRKEDITGFSVMPNGTLGIFTRNSISLLAGTSSGDWTASNQTEYGNNAGAIADTIQTMGSAVRFTDTTGVIDMAASEVSSDFADSIISDDIDELIGELWVQSTASTVVKAKNQYRVFFSDGTGVILVFTQGMVMPTRLRWPNIVRCIAHAEDSTGSEVIYFGSDDGLIYEMENGRSFGGESMAAYAATAFTDLGIKESVKRFRRCRFDMGDVGNSALTVSARLIVEDGGLRNITATDIEYKGEGTPLGDEAILAQTILGALPIIEGSADIEGHAQYISFTFASDTTTDPAWELDGIAIDYFMGRRRR